MVRIDPALSRLAYRCYPNGCPRNRTCCVGLAVSVSRREMRVIDSLMDELARLVPDLRDGSGYADVFVEDADGIQIEPRDEVGTCPFLFRKDDRALCAIHRAAQQSGRDVAAVKPRACRHWPLTLETQGRTVCITVHPDAQMIGCIAPLADLPGQPSIREALADEIAELQQLSVGLPTALPQKSFLNVPRARARARARTRDSFSYTYSTSSTRIPECFENDCDYDYEHEHEHEGSDTF